MEACAAIRNSTSFGYLIAFLRDDLVGMQHNVAASVGTRAEMLVMVREAGTEAYHGRLRSARVLWRRSVDWGRPVFTNAFHVVV